MDATLRFSLNTMAMSIANILGPDNVSIYLLGSLTMDDFHAGWSDVDLLVLTAAPITPSQAERLLPLRQTLQGRDPENPYYPLFEGSMLSLDAFVTGLGDTVVYWGTGKQRIDDRCRMNALDRSMLLTHGQLLLGPDVRTYIARPEPQEIHNAIAAHLDAIRTYGQGSRSIHAFGWLLDAARGVYTLLNGKFASKTEAGTWMLSEGIAPAPQEMQLALQVRATPSLMRRRQVQTQAEELTDAIQRTAKVLEIVLNTSRMDG